MLSSAIGYTDFQKLSVIRKGGTLWSDLQGPSRRFPLPSRIATHHLICLAYLSLTLFHIGAISLVCGNPYHLLLGHAKSWTKRSANWEPALCGFSLLLVKNSHPGGQFPLFSTVAQGTGCGGCAASSWAPASPGAPESAVTLLLLTTDGPQQQR